MPLDRLFKDQINSLWEFLLAPGQTMRCLLTDPAMKQLLERIFQRLDNDEEEPHLFLAMETPFEGTDQFFKALHNLVIEDYQNGKAEWEAAGIPIKLPAAEAGGLSAGQKFVRFIAALAEGMPEQVDSLVLILAPEKISEPKVYRDAMAFLADNTPSQRVKYVVFDPEQQPLLHHIELWADRAEVQTFRFSAGAIEKELRADLQGPTPLPAAQRRKHLAMVARYTFARKEYDETLRLQEECLTLTDPAPDAAEAGLLYYGLGNTHLAKKDWAAAEAAYGEAIQIALDKELDGFLPMALTNLGVTLHRQDRIPEAVQIFAVARKTWQAQNYPPGEAYTLDALAQVYQAEKKNEEAEAAWLEALALVDGIRSEVMQEPLQPGRADLIQKLRQHYQTTNQPSKLERLGRSMGGPAGDASNFGR